MKSGQGILLRAYPGPPPEGLPGCGHDLRNPKPSAGPYGGKGENEACGLVAPPCDPVATSPSVPKAKLLLEHEDAGRTGRRSTLKGKGDSGGGCKEGPRGGNRRFPTTGPSLAPYRRTGNKAEKPRRSPPLLPASGSPRFLVPCGNNRHFPVFSPSFHDSPPCALRAVERGQLWGRCPPSRPLSTPRITPRTSR